MTEVERGSETLVFKSRDENVQEYASDYNN
jgi:hypothetical protein